MRIQETNQILKEGKIHRLDHERHEHAQSGISGFRERLSGIAGKTRELLRRADVRAGLGAAGIALVAASTAFMKTSQKRRRGWLRFAR